MDSPSGSKAGGEPHCTYCGRPIKHGTVCQGHADLPAFDPMMLLKRAPISETAAGVKDQWSVRT